MSNSTNSYFPISKVNFIFILALCWGFPAVSSTVILFGLYDVPQFNDQRLIFLFGFELITGTLALFFLNRKGWEFSLSQIEINWTTTGAGTLLLLTSSFVYSMSYVVGLLFGGDDSVLREVAKLISVSAPIAIAVSVVNGAFEELLLVGFIFKVLERQPLQFIIGVSVLLRVAAHTYQGPVGALGVLATGVLYAYVYARYRQMWTLIFAHILTDAISLLR